MPNSRDRVLVPTVSGTRTWARFRERNLRSRPFPRLRVVDEHYERMRARLLEAIAAHERGELDHAGLQTSMEGIAGALDNAHADVRRALFEADVALEYARYGQPREQDAYDLAAAMRRMRRNLREALK